MKLNPVVILLVSCVSCGDDADLSGMYLVTHHTQNVTDCNVEGASVEEPAYFEMALEEFFGQEYFSLRECETTDEATCSGGGLFFGMIFSIPISNGWKGEMSMSSGTGDPCALTYSEASAVFQDDDSLRVEVRSWGEDVTVSEADCGYELAEDRGKSMPCMSFEVMVGTDVSSGN